MPTRALLRRRQEAVRINSSCRAHTTTTVQARTWATEVLTVRISSPSGVPPLSSMVRGSDLLVTSIQRPPTTLTLDTTGNDGSGVGEIFQTDITGDGTVGDFLPGTEQGYYSRKIKPNTLNKTISRYNSTSAGQLTPAGQTLVSSGLFTQAQLIGALAVTPVLGSAPAYAFPNPKFSQVDFTVSYPIGHGLLHFLPETVSLEPAIAFYNALNITNYSAFAGPTGSLLIDSSQSGSVNSPYDANVRSDARTTRGIGTLLGWRTAVNRVSAQTELLTTDYHKGREANASRPLLCA